MSRLVQCAVLLAVAGCKCGSRTSADGGFTPESVPTYADFCTTQVDLWCTKLVACKTVAAAARTDCASYLGRLCKSLDPSLERGFRTYHADVAAACLSTFQAVMDCDAIASFFGPSCDGVLTPASPTGATCLAEGDCAVKGEHCAGTGCTRSCVAQGALDQPCEFGSSCTYGLWCDAAKICRAPQGPGGACQGQTFQCDTTTWCDGTQGRCTTPPAAGQPCGPDLFKPCRSDAWCDTSNRMCRPRAALGQPCTPISCVEGAWCDRAAAQPTCKVMLADGAPCTLPDECSGTFGICDPTIFVCEQLGSSADSGQPCTTFHRCRGFNDSCKGEVRNPDGGRGSAGTCLPKALGDACATSYDCPNAAYCAAADGGGTCLTAAIGTPCQDDSECQSHVYCGRAGCTARAGSGSACELDRRSCTGALECRPTAVGASTGTCTDPGLGADPCSTASGFRQCSLPFECVAGTCTEHGRLGQPCLQLFFGTCIDGSCADNRTCAAPAADGQMCKGSLDCASANCVAMSCQPLCR